MYAGVALGHALVDDVRVQRGQVQGRDGLRQLENDDGDQQPPVRPQVFNKQFPEHGGSNWSGLTERGAKVSLRPEAGNGAADSTGSWGGSRRANPVAAMLCHHSSLT